jgi:hypothetical protein
MALNKKNSTKTTSISGWILVSDTEMKALTSEKRAAVVVIVW